MINNKPKFITFTGVDEHTNIDEMVQLSREFPIEWGILFSPKHPSKRYPSHLEVLGLFRMLRDVHGVNFAFHLCGVYARQALVGNWDEISTKFLPNSPMVRRAQINVGKIAPDFNYSPLIGWGERNHVTPILQCRSEGFPQPPTARIDYLYDCSGGNGIVASEWPVGTPNRLNGYAGGLNPDNVRQHVDSIAEVGGDYWIDMETGVRDHNDTFSLEKCRAVCEAVYLD